jgi:hypothetical protein
MGLKGKIPPYLISDTGTFRHRFLQGGVVIGSIFYTVTSIYRDAKKPCTNQFEQVIDLHTVIIIPG